MLEVATVIPQEVRSPIVHRLTDELNRIARFGANITDAHTCAVFVPAGLMRNSAQGDSTSAGGLVLAGSHSLANDLMLGCEVPLHTGLIGWVATHGRSIHVAPFEHESRVLGMYSQSHDLKSFIGVPITLGGSDDRCAATGVITCDSKKSFAFSKLQGKWLEDLAQQAATTLSLLLDAGGAGSAHSCWETFRSKAGELASALGADSIDVLRVRLSNFPHIEACLGPSAGYDLFEQFLRLVQQSLPPHFPLFQAPAGDLIIVLDNMMTQFHETRILALAKHLCPPGLTLELEFSRSRRAGKGRSLEGMIRETAEAFDTAPRGEVREHRIA
ncbi:MAG: GAF domain-containing protein [Bdellovibrionota bacterium]|nr:MAG: GAF domain-containing protein [Bdellovibrionota bacterium]